MSIHVLRVRADFGCRGTGRSRADCVSLRHVSRTHRVVLY